MGTTRHRATTLWRKSIGVLLLLYAFRGVDAQLQPVRRVLILNEVSTAWPGIPMVDEGIRSALDTLPYKMEVYREYMDTIYFPDSADQQRFREFYIRKYQNRRPNVIITVGPSPLKFMVETHKEAFPGVPIIFCLPNWAPGTPVDVEFAGVESSVTPVETLEAAFHLNPATKHVLVVGGTSAVDLSETNVVKGALRPYEAKYGISYLPILSMPDVVERLKHLPSDTIVLVTSFSQDGAGSRFSAGGASAIMAAAANVPVFSLASVSINHGEVGGKLASLQEQGRLAGELAVRVLNGQELQKLPRVRSVTTYMFDWRALRRWGLKESKLPPGSVVLNRQPTAWEAFKWYIVAGICLLLAQASLITGLLWQRSIRRKAEAELALTYDRLRLALETGKAVGWQLDVKTRSIRWFGDLRTMFGMASDTFSGHVDDFYRHVYPDDQEPVRNAVADARRNHTPYAEEFRVVRDDEAVRWITARGRFYYANNGDAERMVGMALDITDRKLAEQQVRESQDRLAAIVSSAMDAIIATDKEQRIVLFNNAAEKMLGCSQQEALGTSIDRFIPEHFRAEHSAQLRGFGESGVTNRVMRGLWAVRANGQKFPIEASISQVESAGKKLFTAIIRDITERRQAETAVRESEERFRLVASTAPVMIWMSDVDKKFSYFNKRWLDFTGCTLEQELGDGWTERVHSEDVAAWLKTYTEAFDKREQFEMQYRLRRHDGEYRWISGIGVPRFNTDGSFAGYIGSCLDITERKTAEDALTKLNGRLIEAQEEERKRIAREIHDDYQQRLAMVAIELEEMAATSHTKNRGRLRELWKNVIDLGTDLHSLSHSLHSSTLERLGLIAGVKAFCREFSEQQHIQVDFVHENVPSGIPDDVALCLFRITQEGLRNVKKHSGVDRTEVRLDYVDGKLCLSISDRGRGFDSNIRSTEAGIGIRSMEERLRPFGGKIEICSRSMQGTRIVAWLPFRVVPRSVAS